MSTLAQRVDVVEDRLDHVERLMRQAAERSGQFEERMERSRQEWDRRMQRSREEWDRRMQRADQQREQDREEWDRRM